MTRPRTALTIAGSDSGGGAGIQADLKSFSARGVFGASAITAITAQNTVGVTAIHPIPTDVVAAQISAVLDDIGADAVKIGMLASADIIHAVADALEGYGGPIVLDPVMVSKSGDALLAEEAVAALRDRLIPRATVLTPNLPEAARLTEKPVAAIAEQASLLRGMGARAVIMKGGHGTGETCCDRLFAETAMDCESPRIDTRNTHGTGCSFSAALAAEMAKGESLETAFATSHAWLHRAIVAASDEQLGAGHGPVRHFVDFWS